MQATEIYTRADPSIKLEALNASTAPTLQLGHFRTTDKLIASLTAHSFMKEKTVQDSGNAEVSGTRVRITMCATLNRPVEDLARLLSDVVIATPYSTRWCIIHLLKLDRMSWRLKEEAARDASHDQSR
jgi:hypothetical protein